MKIIIAPDKFKGSLNSFEVCSAIAAGIKEVDAEAEILEFPMADGGDGFASVLQHYLQTETIICSTVDSLGRKIQTSYQWDKKGKIAIIETASASGLVQLKKAELNPLITSTYGTGLEILDAIIRGAKKIILGLGGSSTNDAGTGILQALGFSFEDESGNSFPANGQMLQYIKKIIPPTTHLYKGLEIQIACDVQNSLYGQNGAAFVYAKQKGADDEAVKLLDAGLENYAKVLETSTGKKIANIPGTGAAGGIAASLLAYFDTTITRGIDIVIQASKIHDYIQNTRWMITGEGKIDGQTLEGKVVSEIAELAHREQIPVIAFCGLLEASTAELAELKLKAVEQLVSCETSKYQAIQQAGPLLTEKVKSYFKHQTNI